MSALRKAFRGYRVSDVDEQLSAMEARLNAATSRCELLEKQLQEARQAADEARADLASRDDELERINQAYERLRAQQREKRNEAETIGHIYLKAFENGREIVTAPRTHVAQYLSTIESATERARLDVSAAEREFSDIAGTIGGLVAEINHQTATILRRLETLSASVGGIDAAYAGFEQARVATQADIHAIQTIYEQMVSSYLESPEGPSPIPESPAAAHPAAVAPSPLPTQPASTPVSSFSSPTFSMTSETSVQSILAEPSAAATSAQAQETAGPLATGEIQGDSEQEAKAEPMASAPADSPAEETTGEAPPDTAADFRDGPGTVFAPEKSEQSDEPDRAGESAAPITDKKAEAVRGQNILNLLSKYQKR